MICQNCKLTNFKKFGSYKSKTELVQRYRCKTCKKTQTKRTNSENYRLRKRRLAKKIEALYCERMSLRGIARVLGIDRKTVNRYFLRMAYKARSENLKNLDNREIISTFVQFDALEIFEHTKRKPLGVWLSVRAKTGEIVSAKVHRTDIRALAMSKKEIVKWNSRSNKESSLVDFLLETKKSLNRAYSVLGCDGYHFSKKIAQDICGDIAHIIVLGENKKIDLAIRKIRNDISRLSRKSLCSTKKAERLQNHLDLYINYHNRKRVLHKS